MRHDELTRTDLRFRSVLGTPSKGGLIGIEGGFDLQWRGDASVMAAAAPTWPTDNNITIITFPADSALGGRFFCRRIFLRGQLNWNTGAQMTLNINNAGSPLLDNFTTTDGDFFIRGQTDSHYNAVNFPLTEWKEFGPATDLAIRIDSTGTTGPYTGFVYALFVGRLIPELV